MWGTSGVDGPDLMGRESCHSQSPDTISRAANRNGATNRTVANHNGAANRNGATNRNGAPLKVGLRRRPAASIVPDLTLDGLRGHRTDNLSM
ncbi:hypothetical protein AAU01_10770 [Paenarthrobacter aurescens]|uniref:Uncharacterized protein n=1 Tax=Paenarthrobacter aurescens TaxID=43663 RepID=A0A4Y3N9J8_PAEAU|nr:hypothetical protein AAU01_10770 [Paenarthrobacter aurescens]